MTGASMQGAHLPVDDAVVAAAFHPVEAAIARIALELPAAPGDDQLDLWNKSGILEDGVVHLEEGGDSAGANDLARSASDAQSSSRSAGP